MKLLAQHEAEYFAKASIAAGEFQRLWESNYGGVDWINRESDYNPAVVVVPMGEKSDTFLFSKNENYVIHL